MVGKFRGNRSRWGKVKRDREEVYKGCTQFKEEYDWDRKNNN